MGRLHHGIRFMMVQKRFSTRETSAVALRDKTASSATDFVGAPTGEKPQYGRSSRTGAGDGNSSATHNPHTQKLPECTAWLVGPEGDRHGRRRLVPSPWPSSSSGPSPLRNETS